MGWYRTTSTLVLQREIGRNMRGGAIHPTAPLSMGSVLITAGVGPFDRERDRGGEGRPMPNFCFSTALHADQLGANPLAGWQYEWTPYPCSIILLIRSTAVTTLLPVFS